MLETTEPPSVLLASAGHGFEVLEDLEMFEVKQGPYAAHEDKVRFEGVHTENVQLKGRQK